MFDPVAGTVEPIEEYDETDMVATWYSKEREEDLVGKKWDPECDAMYMRNAVRGWGTFVFQTRKHSSRMRTARFCGSGGGLLPGSLVRGRGYGPRGCMALPPPVNRQTHVKTLPSRNFVCGR